MSSLTVHRQEIEPTVRMHASLVRGLLNGNGIAPSSVLGLCSIESWGNPDAESAMNFDREGRPIGRAQGAMQVMPWHFDVTVDPVTGELTDEQKAHCRDRRRNFGTAIELLGDLYRRTQALDKACAAYFGAFDWRTMQITDWSDVTGTSGNAYVQQFFEARDWYLDLDVEAAEQPRPPGAAPDVAREEAERLRAALVEELAARLARDFEQIGVQQARARAMVEARDFAGLRGLAINIGIVANEAMARVDQFAPGPQRKVDPVERTDDGRWRMPCDGAITQGFHWPPDAQGQYHTGVDVANAYGAPVRSPLAGMVVATRRMLPNTGGYPEFDHRVLESNLGGWSWLKDTYGSIVVIRSTDGSEFCLLAHSCLNYPVGTAVSKGEIAGWTDNTGLTSGPHVHFELRGADNTGEPRDPMARM
jgi:murein DD-endopeptidase MepM/ murein hydrolase activator NlpD